jgi:hypothetical protein
MWDKWNDICVYRNVFEFFPSLTYLVPQQMNETNHGAHVMGNNVEVFDGE